MIPWLTEMKREIEHTAAHRSPGADGSQTDKRLLALIAIAEAAQGPGWRATDEGGECTLGEALKQAEQIP